MNYDKRISATMVLNSSNFNKAIKEANEELKTIKTAANVASTGITAYGQSCERVKAVQQSLNKQIELNSKKINLYKEAIEKTTNTLNKNIKERDNLKSSLEKANKEHKEAIKTYGKESEQAKKTKEEIEKLKEEYNKKKNAVENNSKAIQKYERNINEAQTAINKTTKELNTFNSTIEKQKNSVKLASENIRNSSEGIINLGSKINSVSDKMLVFAGVISTTGIAATKLSNDFNKEMANIGTLIPQNTQRLEELKTSIQDIAITVAKNTGDIAEGTYNVISAFGDTADTMQKVEINAKAATAGMASTKDAIDLSSAVMKGYGDTTAAANEKVMDLSFQTVKLGQTTFPELAKSIGKVVPLSNELKISQEELFTIFATGTGVTGNAAEVATQYRGILQSLMAPTKEVTNLIQKLGYADAKTLIEKEGLINAIEKIVKAANDSKTPLKNYIGSIEGQTLALALAGEQNEVYKDKLEKLKNSAGSMGEAFKEQTEGINKTGFEFQQSMIKMQVAGQKFGDAMAPILEKTANIIGKLADEISDLSDEQKENIVKWGAITIAATGATKVLGTSITTIGTLGKGIATVTELLEKGSKETKKLETATEGLGTAASIASGSSGIGSLIVVLGKAIAVAAPFILVTGGVIAACSLLYESFKDVAEEVRKDAIPSFQETIDSIEGISDTTKNTVKEIKEEIGKIDDEIIRFEADGSLTIKEVQQMTNTINGFIDNSIDHIKTRLSQGGEHISDFYKTLNEENKQLWEKGREGAAEEGKKQIEQLEKDKARVKEILDQAAKENRNRTKEEQIEINDIISRAAEYQLKARIENMEELKRLNSNMLELEKTASKETSLQIIQDARAVKEEKIKIAEETYQNSLNEISRMTELSQNEKNQLLNQAKEYKEARINEAEAEYNGIYATVQNKFPEIIDYIDIANGKILTDQEAAAKKHERLEREKWANNIQTMSEAYNNINNMGTFHFGQEEQHLLTSRNSWAKYSANIDIQMKNVKTALDNGIIDKNRYQQEINKLSSNKKFANDMIGELNSLIEKFSSGKITARELQKEINSLKSKTIYVTTIFHQQGKKTPGGNQMIGYNWQGTNYWRGGLTYLHERGFELYEMKNLPSGTKIYNHEASESLVKEAAERVANKVANKVMDRNNSSIENITINLNIEGKTIAKEIVPITSNLLAKNIKAKR